MRVLVTYASKHGSTADVGQRIALDLGNDGVEAEAIPVGEAGDIERFDAVVLGSSVYFGMWMPEAVGFVQRNHAQLAARPLWLFSLGPLGDQPRTDPGEIARLGSSLNIEGHHLFYGVLDTNRLSFLERTIVKAVKAPTGDFRDWNEVDSWAATIADRLKQPVAPQS